MKLSKLNMVNLLRTLQWCSLTGFLFWILTAWLYVIIKGLIVLFKPNCVTNVLEINLISSQMFHHFFVFDFLGGWFFVLFFFSFFFL